MAFKDPSIEHQALAMMALDEGVRLVERFSTLTRESGSHDERIAAEYIVDRLKALGVPVTVYEPELYLSVPERSELRVHSNAGRAASDDARQGRRALPGNGALPGSGELPGNGELIASRPPAFSRSTGDRPVVGPLRYVSSQYAVGTASLFDTPAAAISATGRDLDGVIVLTEGFSMPGTVHAFERRGALAQVFIHPGSRIHEGICTPIWGAPTHESITRRPRTPVVCVSRPDGERLIALATNGSPHVSVATWLREGWSRCLLPVVELRGAEDADEFLLVHGHYDSWYVGIGDNATGNAALLEIARVLRAIQSGLKRSVRIAWWPGHSTGRYAGSTWYADAFADELDEWCIAHLNIDSPGCRSATAFDEVMWMAEAAELCIESIVDATGVQPRGMRPLRAGDYSFNQIGPTAFYMLLSNIPEPERKARGFYAVGGCGGHTAWHTPDDLLPVFDPAILKQDLGVYLTTIIRALNAPLHPFDYTGTVAEIAGAVQRYQEAAAGHIDLNPVLEDLRTLRQEIVSWRAGVEDAVKQRPDDVALRRAANATLRRLARMLVPLAYARGERFDHGPAVKLPAVPRLEAAARVAQAADELQPFSRTALVRERNKIRAILREARREVVATSPVLFEPP